MSQPRAMSQPRTRVTDTISVVYQGEKVHLEISAHLDSEYTEYFSQALLLPPLVARQLGEALIEMAALDAVPAVA